jgi:hypothetical protein
MALSSPGVEVKVIDESFYTPAEPGTVPLIVVASAENKLNGSGTGIAPGTLKANANQLYLITSQRDLVETFGDPVFKTDSNNNPIHAGEQNEYGLHAAYSLLGVSNRAFVIRTDLDLNQLDARVTPPVAEPMNGTYWLDTKNSVFGIFEWNGSPATVAGGQTFTNKVPLVITDMTQLEPDTDSLRSGYKPKGSVGAIGDYAIVVASNWSTLDFDQHLYYRRRDGEWVLVGSQSWADAWPTVVGTKSVSLPIAQAGSFYINGALINVLAGQSLQDIANTILAAGIDNGAISARVFNNRLEIYHDGTYGSGDDSASANVVSITAGDTALVALNAADSILGIAVGNYYNPRTVISKHTQVPAFKSKDPFPRPSGSLWIKTTQANLGARWRIKRFNGAAGIWEDVEAPIFMNNQEALAEMDRVGGGANLPIGAVYIQANYEEDFGTDSTPRIASFKLMRRNAVGATTIRSSRITSSTFPAGTYTFKISETLAGDPVLGGSNLGDPGSPDEIPYITFTATGSTDDAEVIARAINTPPVEWASGWFRNITAEVDSQNRVIIKHKLGGDFRLADGDGEPLEKMEFTPFNPISKLGTVNLLAAPVGDIEYDFIASLWVPLVYTASDTAPSELTEDGKLWYSSVIDEVDIMIHDGTRWVGYKSPTSPFYDADPELQTDPLGPIVSATAPERQSDDTELVTGDLWINTSDIENFPRIYKFNADIPNRTIRARWILVDSSDQSSEDGIVFADARYNTAGANSEEPGEIVDLLESDFVDFDAPDPALYPRGMMLWNLRRSGFNVKAFRQNYIDTASDNPRFGAAPTFKGESMDGYYPHRWVTVSANQPNGAGTFGRKAQRAVVVQALQATVNSNEQIRDEESRVFNLISCPGYPELVGEMVSLNYDRGLTAFVVADTPARLPADATSLLNWGTNQRLALEDNDLGLVSSDEYLGFFYPWGFTSDNFGNNVAVPPSHMMLRTIALNDQVAYPWFAPAGVRRGGITNATAVGYIDDEGEFRSVALNVGQRDTLASVKVNPITFITGTGLVNYGQYTRARAASALDRINVARLVIYLRRQLTALAKPYIFEPNDKITRDEIKAAVESLLLELVGQRALYDFLVVCDESNNTPARIDRSELYIDIAIEPVKAVEFIYIPLRLKNTGEING